MVRAGSHGLVWVVHPLTDVDRALTPGTTMCTPHCPARPSRCVQGRPQAWRGFPAPALRPLPYAERNPVTIRPLIDHLGTRAGTTNAASTRELGPLRAESHVGTGSPGFEPATVRPAAEGARRPTRQIAPRASLASRGADSLEAWDAAVGTPLVPRPLGDASDGWDARGRVKAGLPGSEQSPVLDPRVKPGAGWLLGCGPSYTLPDPRIRSIERSIRAPCSMDLGSLRVADERGNRGRRPARLHWRHWPPATWSSLKAEPGSKQA